jgi:hypothetical protein
MPVPDCRRQHTMTNGTDPALTQFIGYGLDIRETDTSAAASASPDGAKADTLVNGCDSLAHQLKTMSLILEQVLMNTHHNGETLEHVASNTELTMFSVNSILFTLGN